MDIYEWRGLKKQYDYLSVFLDGYAVAEIDNKYFHISEKTGLPAYKERYDNVFDFINGLAAVNIGNESFHIRADGTPAYQKKFVDVGNFYGDTAFVQVKGGRWMKIDKNGNQVSRYFENWEV